jgi:L-lactate dehydrogenase complex protein LldF
MASKMAHTVVKPLTTGNKITKGVGPLKEWTDYKDMPTPNKERFRDWFKEHSKGGNQ